MGTRLLALFICPLVLIFIPFKGYSQYFDYKENAVYTYNFIKYTSWPVKKTSIQIGIIGRTALENEFRNLIAAKKNSSIEYSVRNIGINEARSVDVVILAESSSNQIKDLEQQTSHLPILIITEKMNLSRLGACISFFIDDDNNYKTEYQLSLRNCKARGLKVSDQIQNNAVLIR